MTDNTQPEALRLALSIDLMDTFTNYQQEELNKAAAELRRLQARITGLEAQLESAGYTAADMATAAAQGFRDGAASLLANAGEPLQVFESPRAKALMRAWEEGWGACRDAEFVGEEAQNDAFNQSNTVNHCIAEDMAHQDHSLAATPQPAPAIPAVNDDLRDGLVAISKVIADQDDRAAQAMLREILATPQPSPTAQADSGAAPAGGSNWQDISTAPRDGTRFVAVGQNYGLASEKQHTCIAQWFRGCWMEVSDWNETSKLEYLTHWMPLPPLPGSAARKQGANHD